jgi:hypothetical protein
LKVLNQRAIVPRFSPPEKPSSYLLYIKVSTSLISKLYPLLISLLLLASRLSRGRTLKTSLLLSPFPIRLGISSTSSIRTPSLRPSLVLISYYPSTLTKAAILPKTTSLEGSKDLLSRRRSIFLNRGVLVLTRR